MSRAAVSETEGLNPVVPPGDETLLLLGVPKRANWAPMNEVYFANFTDDPPHRVSCIVSGLGSPECLVEIDATAYLGAG